MSQPVPPLPKKRLIRVLVESLGDAIVLLIRFWRIAGNPRRRPMLIRLTSEGLRRRWAPVARRLDPYYQVLRRWVLHPLHLRWRLLRRRITAFHRATPVPRLRMLYLAALLGIVLITGLVTYLVVPRPRPISRMDDLAIASLMEDTANQIASKHLRKAERNIEKLKAVIPENATVHTFSGAVKSLQEDYAGAREEYAKALALNPGSFNAAFNLAEVDFVTKNYPRAQEQFQKMLEARPGDEILLFRLYLCALMQNDRPRANALLDVMPQVGATPASYYAKAAGLIVDKKTDAAGKIVATARVLYPDKTAFFEATFQTLGFK